MGFYIVLFFKGFIRKIDFFDLSGLFIRNFFKSILGIYVVVRWFEFYMRISGFIMGLL